MPYVVAFYMQNRKLDYMYSLLLLLSDKIFSTQWEALRYPLIMFGGKILALYAAVLEITKIVPF